MTAADIARGAPWIGENRIMRVFFASLEVPGMFEASPPEPRFPVAVGMAATMNEHRRLVR